MSAITDIRFVYEDERLELPNFTCLPMKVPSRSGRSYCVYFKRGNVKPITGIEFVVQNPDVTERPWGDFESFAVDIFAGEKPEANIDDDDAAVDNPSVGRVFMCIQRSPDQLPLTNLAVGLDSECPSGFTEVNKLLHVEERISMFYKPKSIYSGKYVTDVMLANDMDAFPRGYVTLGKDIRVFSQKPLYLAYRRGDSDPITYVDVVPSGSALHSELGYIDTADEELTEDQPFTLVFKKKGSNAPSGLEILVDASGQRKVAWKQLNEFPVGAIDIMCEADNEPCPPGFMILEQDLSGFTARGVRLCLRPCPQDDRYDHTQFFDSARSGDAMSLWREIVHGADVNHRDENGNTAFIVAAKAQRLECMSILLDEGANINARDKDENTPLLLVTRWVKDSYDLTSFLLQSGADAKAKNNQNENALHLAARWGRNEALTALLEFGQANLSAKNSKGETPLFLASRWGREETVGMLLQAGAPVDGKSQAGDTPLMVAASLQKTGVVKHLLDAGADIEIRRTSGQNAFDLAFGRGFKDVAQIIKDTAEERANAENETEDDAGQGEAGQGEGLNEDEVASENWVPISSSQRDFLNYLIGSFEADRGELEGPRALAASVLLDSNAPDEEMQDVMAVHLMDFDVDGEWQEHDNSPDLAVGMAQIVALKVLLGGALGGLSNKQSRAAQGFLYNEPGFDWAAVAEQRGGASVLAPCSQPPEKSHSSSRQVSSGRSRCRPVSGGSAVYNTVYGQSSHITEEADERVSFSKKDEDDGVDEFISLDDFYSGNNLIRGGDMPPSATGMGMDGDRINQTPPDDGMMRPLSQATSRGSSRTLSRGTKEEPSNAEIPKNRKQDSSGHHTGPAHSRHQSHQSAWNASSAGEPRKLSRSFSQGSHQSLYHASRGTSIGKATAELERPSSRGSSRGSNRAEQLRKEVALAAGSSEPPSRNISRGSHQDVMRGSSTRPGQIRWPSEGADMAESESRASKSRASSKGQEELLRAPSEARARATSEGVVASRGLMSSEDLPIPDGKSVHSRTMSEQLVMHKSAHLRQTSRASEPILEHPFLTQSRKHSMESAQARSARGGYAASIGSQRGKSSRRGSEVESIAEGNEPPSNISMKSIAGSNRSIADLNTQSAKSSRPASQGNHEPDLVEELGNTGSRPTSRSSARRSVEATSQGAATYAAENPTEQIAPTVHLDSEPNNVSDDVLVDKKEEPATENMIEAAAPVAEISLDKNDDVLVDKKEEPSTENMIEAAAPVAEISLDKDGIDGDVKPSLGSGGDEGSTDASKVENAAIPPTESYDFDDNESDDKENTQTAVNVNMNTNTTTPRKVQHDSDPSSKVPNSPVAEEYSSDFVDEFDESFEASKESTLVPVAE